MNEEKLAILKEELALAEVEVDNQLRQRYTQLSDSGQLTEKQREDLYGEVRREISLLKEASTRLRGLYQKASVAADELDTRLHDLTASQKKRRIIPAAPANGVIDLQEQKTCHFTQGLNFYKLFWVCFIGCFAGVVIEMLWCLVRNGYIESRAGLVYGPFNLLYGVGALALTAALYPYRNRSQWLSFFGGMLIGSLVEYICSWGQEMIFGSRSWDYSGVPFNLNGRICLLYSIFWGFLGVLWIKNIYPRMAQMILKIPNKPGKILSWVLTVFLVFNSLMTVVSVWRWTQRLDGVAPANGWEAFLDERFPNERMERIFANMEFNRED